MKVDRGDSKLFLSSLELTNFNCERFEIFFFKFQVLDYAFKYFLEIFVLYHLILRTLPKLLNKFERFF